MFGVSMELGYWCLELRDGASAPRSAGPHARVEEADEGVEAVLVGADDEAAERVGEVRLPRGLALAPPGGVRGALGGAALDRDEPAGERVVGGKRLAARQRAVPRVVDPEAHRLVTALQHGPALGQPAWRKVAEPDEHA